MPLILDDNLEAIVLGLHLLKFSTRAIVAKLKREGKTISKTTVNRIVRAEGKRREAKASVVPFKQERKCTVRTTRAISIVSNECDKENPATQRQLANKLSCSTRTVDRIIHDDLKKRIRKKPTVHCGAVPCRTTESRARS